MDQKLYRRPRTVRAASDVWIGHHDRIHAGGVSLQPMRGSRVAHVVQPNFSINCYPSAKKKLTRSRNAKFKANSNNMQMHIPVKRFRRSLRTTTSDNQRRSFPSFGLHVNARQPADMNARQFACTFSAFDFEPLQLKELRHRNVP